MKLERMAFAVALALAACVTVPSARAQVTSGKTIKLKVKTSKPQKPHYDMFRGEVLKMDAQSIIVRDPSNTAVIKTFTYTPELSKKLQRLINRGGYQYGDRVQIKYASGGTVAQSITGKASKPR